MANQSREYILDVPDEFRVGFVTYEEANVFINQSREMPPAEVKCRFVPFNLFFGMETNPKKSGSLYVIDEDINE